MSTLPPCPKCKCEYTYEHGTMITCPECAHEWSTDAAAAPDGDGPPSCATRTATCWPTATR